jgi:Zn-finger protein
MKEGKKIKSCRNCSIKEREGRKDREELEKKSSLKERERVDRKR